MGTSNNDALFNYEYDFKEQHTKHLKRPALVAIKKPLLYKNEMEDILIRLLNLHVPAMLDEKASQSGIGRRAFLVDNQHFIQRSAASGENTSFVQRGIFEINHKNNIYITPTIDDTAHSNPLYFWLSPDYMRTHDRRGENLNSFSYSESDKSSKEKDYRDTHMFRAGDPGYVMAKTAYNSDVKQITSERNATVYKSFNPNFSTTTGEYTYFPGKVVDKSSIVKFDLFLLNTADHNHLQCDVKTRLTTLKEILEKSYLFAKNGLPQFKGYHEIYNPNDSKGLNHIMDSSAARRAFGYLPKTVKNAYHWEFYCPTTTRVAVLQDESVKKLDKKYAGKSFEELVRILVTLFDGYPADESMAYKQVRNWVHTFDDPGKTQLGDEQKIDLHVFSNNEVQKNTYIRSLTEALNALPDVDPGQVRYKTGSEGLYHYQQPLKSTKKLMLSAIDAYKFAGKTALVLLGEFKETYKDELAEAKNTALRSRFIKPKRACDITLGKFKIEYYSILLKKVKEKYDKLKYFIETTKTVRLNDINLYDTLIKEVESSDIKKASEKKLDDLSWREEEFITTAEKFFYSPFSGFYITSYSDTKKEVLSPYWNSVATTGMIDTATYNQNLSNDTNTQDLLINNQNKDVASISIDRVISGISTATIVIKNDREKYNYEPNDILKRSNFIIEPMDEIAVYLPTTKVKNNAGVLTNEDRINIVFSGIVSRVVGVNNAGMHSITVSAECYKKYLKINRTNTRPSATREESGNKMVQAFDMPYEFYNTIERWMTYMFVTSLTSFGTELSYVNNNNEPLFKVAPAPIKATVSHTIIKHANVVKKVTESEQLTYEKTRDIAGPTALQYVQDVVEGVGKSVTNGVQNLIKNTQRSEEVKSCPVTYSEKKQIQTKVTYEYEPSVITDASRTITVGNYTQATFADPLLTYLWYKVNSVSFPKEEQGWMETNLKAVLNAYTYTAISGETSAEDKDHVLVKYLPGCKDFLTYLREGKRLSYFVYRTRNKQYTPEIVYDNTTKKETKKVSQEEKPSSTLPTGICVAKIIGTSQPAYQLKTANFDIQFSSWKTNNDLIQDVANRFNFLYYTDKEGVVLFTPYNFDLTTLNTENNSHAIDTNKMLVYRSKRDVQNDDNVQILKDQYLINFTNTDDDKEIINWLTLTGNWSVERTQSVDQFTKAVVTDPVLITRFGYRASKNISILGLQDAQALRLYGLSYMDRKNKRYRSATATVLFDSRMDVNLPYYVPCDEVIYFCEGMRINYVAGETCTSDMILSYGKKPLVELEPYVFDTKFSSSNMIGTKVLNAFVETASTDKLDLIQQLDKLFTQDNVIKPSTWAQYKKLLDPRNLSVKNTQWTLGNATDSEEERNKKLNAKLTINSAICCFNGLLWDNVAGISFEELVYDYGWLVSGFGAGVTTAEGANGKLMESLELNTDDNYILSLINLNDKARNALRTFYVNVPAIHSDKVPPQLDTKHYVYDDLRVDGILNPDTLK